MAQHAEQGRRRIRHAGEAGALQRLQGLPGRQGLGCDVTHISLSGPLLVREWLVMVLAKVGEASPGIYHHEAQWIDFI